MKLPWEKGNDGWDNYGDFLLWMREQFQDYDDDWLYDSPTLLMAVMYNLAKDVEDQCNAKYDRLVEKLKTVQLTDNTRLMKIIEDIENDEG